jgi:uncharacterized membrane protein YccC
LFNIIEPAGWSVGLVRIEDVAIGCGISLLVGVLLWPRGAGAALTLALSDALASAARYLASAVDRVTDALFRDGTDSARAESTAASERLNDAFRQYLAERGSKATHLAALSSVAGGITRARLAAFTLANLPPSPIEQGKPELKEVADAARSLRSLADQSAQWSTRLLDVVKEKRGDVHAVPSGPDELQRQLLDAAQQCRRQGRADRIQIVLQMLLADEALRDLHDLEQTAGSFVRLSAPPVRASPTMSRGRSSASREGSP